MTMAKDRVCKNGHIQDKYNLYQPPGCRYTSCRSCNAAAVKRYKQKHPGIASESAYRSMVKYPEKHRARVKLQTAIKRGKIIKPDTCTVTDDMCSGNLEAHHPDYSMPRNVIWFCRKHHSAEHIRLRKEASYAK